MAHLNSILIVDDESGARDILEALLLHEGYVLGTACCGAEALEKAGVMTPSLVLLDVMMPEMDGFEVCRRLREMPLLAEVPVIMITALDDRESRLEGIRAGADDFLSKPFDREELRARVKTIMRLDRYRRLHTERAKFEWVIQHAHDGYVIINSDGGLLYANSHARLYLNLPEDLSESLEQESLSQNSFLELACDGYLLEPQDAWTSWPNSLTEPRYLVRPESSTSESFWLQVDVLEMPDESGGKVIHLYDVSAKMSAQLNRWSFQTMMCHKLRTPLVGILGSLEFLADHAESLDTTEMVEFSKMSLISARRLHGEIEDILQYMGSSGMTLPEQFCPLAELPSIVKDIAKNIKLEHVSVEVADELSHTFLPLSRRTVELIFYETLENSVKFHPEQRPEVRITTSSAQEQELTILIADNGITLSPGQLSQLWVPYYQGEKYLTGEESGMGLGLSMVAAFIWKARGSCRAYNHENPTGLTLELRFPAIPESSLFEGENA
ncbi:MAG: hybrid sensor histidine kinase/response regulator [bacterium]|nr:hybrid sensor histidine kinase/response regulator [bacterium]